MFISFPVRKFQELHQKILQPLLPTDKNTPQNYKALCGFARDNLLIGFRWQMNLQVTQGDGRRGGGGRKNQMIVFGRIAWATLLLLPSCCVKWFRQYSKPQKTPLDGLLERPWETVTHVKWTILLASSGPLGPKASTCTEKGLPGVLLGSKRSLLMCPGMGSLRMLAMPPAPYPPVRCFWNPAGEFGCLSSVNTTKWTKDSYLL